MKAFNQINFQMEHRLVWSYSVALIFIGLFIMFTPVFAQQDDADAPDVKVDIKKEYNELGTLIRVDSVRTWCWSGEQFSQQKFDSLWEDISGNLDHFLPRNFDYFRFNRMPPGPPMHNFWRWNGEDSSAYSYFHDFDQYAETFEENFKDYSERIHKYKEEHQKLIEKYFRKPYQDEDIDPEAEPKNDVPVPKGPERSKTGKI